MNYCKYCGQPLPKRKTSYCNVECQVNFLKTPVVKQCECCGEEFKSKYGKKQCWTCLLKTRPVPARPKKQTAKPHKTFDDYITAFKAAEEKGEHLSYGKWAAMN